MKLCYVELAAVVVEVVVLAVVEEEAVVVVEHLALELQVQADLALVLVLAAQVDIDIAVCPGLDLVVQLDAQAIGQWEELFTVVHIDDTIQTTIKMST